VRVGDYATSVGFPALAAAGLRHRLPVYSVDPADIATPGCLAVVGWDPEADGAQAGALAVQVLRGRSPATMAFEPVTRKLLLLNRRTARAIGVTFPPELLRQADRVTG
ncbi:ABC transporter substrate binding protein, partial [Synechococcus sp. BA-120 BA3]|nr:ABC transporter substrate binding protein [Synechococcus sp. BA-120 BA3]